MPCQVNDRDKNNPEEKGRSLFIIKIFKKMCNGPHKICTSQRTDYVGRRECITNMQTHSHSSNNIIKITQLLWKQL